MTSSDVTTIQTGDGVGPNPLAEGLHDYRVAEPALMVIFGATGDLSARKLLPALYNLAKQRLLPAGFAVVGAAIDNLDDAGFRKHAAEKIALFSRTQPVDSQVLQSFLEAVFYVKVDFSKLEDFKALARKLDELDHTRHVGGNRVFYCATPPPTYETITEQLMATAVNAGPGYHRIVIEKPFGSDLKSARELNKIVQRVFHEDSVYRIDHYLGKETVQNIMAFRFANTIFEPVWNCHFIDSVQITAAEEIGVENRGAYYDRAGAMRDIVQNHVLQLLALTAMEPPIAFEANAVRDEKVKVLKAIRPISDEEVVKATVRGQYTSGWVLGEHVPGYREEPNVAPGSLTETFVALRLYVDNWRWAGVPFYIRAGKRMPKRATEIRILFSRPPHLTFGRKAAQELDPNSIILRIQPEEGISLRFGAKVPAAGIRLRSVAMDFLYASSFLIEVPEAYERLLLDCMIGDATLFTRADEVETAWALVDPVEAAWRDGRPPLQMYPAGTWGPPAAAKLLEAEGREWHRP
ncbi:MAG TPA: glucose-6-phosphate dehydrogenase [Candidatus Dormibacteraeota bacterium]|nr:glucose-6-phosphate dehydrogenase [Candidatus Dormibacteraeota bacterium]